ncbi:type VII secretion integral membrane protein EccD [Mycolicibacter minnesotensis]|uniref:Type VII secretion integral membrane protein EccD n=1 Tax=Mycolicibacter minnesotensis TaxID=1118379 RepID=A0A7I7R6N2_9MYCO|nr:type VII secretion integral membrane protein EccD [Mycolicibacter minnesotensis]ORB00369.1 type VII secretion integral membrane protein EccD [Mycolicibacter minnesotensis]BBY33740.1 ESX-2 secretion system protein eccD2 [Mycolicibacter minnesotensis]
MTSPTPAKVAFPARCAVSLAYDKHLVSQVFPAGIPVEEFFEGMVELLDEDLRHHGFDGVALPPGSYELHKVNGVRLDITRSLDDLGVQDGDTLVLVPVVGGDSFEPQYESLSSALAATARRLGAQPEIRCQECGHKADEQTVTRLLNVKVDRMFAPVTALTAAHTAVGLMALAVVVLSALAVRARMFSDSWPPAAVLVGVGALLALGAAVIRRNWSARDDLFSGFGWLAVLALSCAALCAAPGALGAPHLMIGVTVLALGAIGLSVLLRAQTAVATAIVTAAGIGGAVALARMWHPVSPPVIGICTLLGLLILLRMSPTIALWVARVRPPYFGSITGRDLFARRANMPIDTVSPVTPEEDDDEDDLVDISARGAAIAASARLINAVQVGMCVAIAATLPIAVWMVLIPGGPRQRGAVALCGLVAGLFITQGRGFAGRVQAIALVGGACTAVLTGIVKYALASPGDTAAGFLWPAAAIAVFAGLGVAAGLLVPETKFVPWIRLAVEWLEVLAFIAVGVLGAWLGGLFVWVRN